MLIDLVNNLEMLAENQKEAFRDRYLKTAMLYYKGQPDFDELLNTIKANIYKL